MNRSTLLLLALLVLHTPAFALDVQSRIDAVAVYPSGAVVTRVARVELPAGTSTVRLTGLVNDLDPDQLQLQAVAANVELGQVRIDREQQRDAFNEEIDSLNADIAALQEKIAAIDDSVKSAELRLKFLDGLAAGYSKEAWLGSARGAADINSWRQALALLESASTDAYASIRAQKAARVAAERDLSLLQRNLASKRGAALSSTVLEVTVRAATATTTDLRLNYFQDEAGWQSQYEARLDSNDGILRLTQQAVVAQGTDESWDNVELSLSTSDPSGDLEPGKLDSEFLDFYEPVPAAPARSRLQQLGAMADSMEEVSVAASKEVASRVGNYAVTYDLPGRVSVANNSDEMQSFDVTAFESVVMLVTRIVPRNGDQAYLAARFLYEGSVPLYESDLRVYVDGAYAGASTMPTALPQTEVTVPMGQDRRVEVKIVDQGAVTGRGGIVSRQKTESTNYIFEITNRRQSETVVEVVDLYPVSRNKDIEVDVARNSTEPTEKNIDDQPGVVLWRKTLQSNESWRIQHEYTVTYPADKVLSRR